VALQADISPLQKSAFVGLILLSLASLFYAFYSQDYVLMAIPAAVLVIYLAFLNFKWLYWMMLALMPLAFEVHLAGGLSMSIPTEPLMFGLMLVSVLYFLFSYRQFNWNYFKNPILVLLFIHLFWIFVTAMNSVVPLVSFKFLLAKLWFVTSYSFLSLLIIQEIRDFKTVFWVIFIPLSLGMLYVIGHHATYGFSFDDVNKPVEPFFRNHVNYAAILSLFYPFIWLAASWYRPGSFKRRLLWLAKWV
jgi:hypothetical protein